MPMAASTEQIASAAPGAVPGRSAAAALPDTPARGRLVRWYRTPIDPALLRELSRRSDFRGALQTLGYLGLYAATAALAIYSASHWRWYATVPLVFGHGMV